MRNLLVQTGGNVGGVGVGNEGNQRPSPEAARMQILTHTLGLVVEAAIAQGFAADVHHDDMPHTSKPRTVAPVLNTVVQAPEAR